jgi:NADH-quinone oxidoreductase subunit A
MTELVGYLILFTFLGFFFVFIHLVIGRLIRPNKPNPEKAAIYECGEPAIGSSWIQFDLRFYVVALLFVIFDVEVAFFFPWATVFGKVNALGNHSITPEQRVELTRALDPAFQAEDAGTIDEISQRHAAVRMGWLAFFDIVVFFSFLIVGFAYLWRRGDLDWVRSTAAERTGMELAAQPPPG